MTPQLMLYAVPLKGKSTVTSIIRSIKNIPIRLTDERWEHISRGHPELVDQKQKILETVANPQAILEGGEEELLAVTKLEPGKLLVVVYREFEEDGFIITAYKTTTRRNNLKRRNRVWP